ncbi:hypothetical protein [Anaerosacchariphilus polymeriproducens]|uniref:Uncharacterized protein n=1 Tax=Anaerosacchariphilus polymeriproducens TaxID=1812858 RepID=A0A371AV67_9FIRM|nr:hypothetical protein [Anaerosacchariphilus polymeriproducens]RDU23439.1 hypothetical protein DWV06_09535 [Anaerosacchariphilus polymeriproducens]
MIKRKIIKKMILGVLLLTCLVGLGVTAQTQYFTVRLTYNGKNEDRLSKKTLKAGGDKFEYVFYATPISFNVDGCIYAKSVSYSYPHIHTDQVVLSSRELHKKQFSAYYIKPHEREYYYLEAKYIQSLSLRAITAKGRYTP